MKQAARNRIFDGYHSQNIIIAFHFAEHVFERIAANQFDVFVLKVFVGCDVVIRARYSLYGYSFHFPNAFKIKNPVFVWKRDFVSY